MRKLINNLVKKMVSVQQETKSGLKAYLLNSLYGILKLKRKAGTEAQSAKHDEGELLKHEKMRDQAQALLRYKAL